LNGHQVRVLTENEQTAEKAFPSTEDNVQLKSAGQLQTRSFSANQARRQLYTEILNNPKVSEDNKQNAPSVLKNAKIENEDDAIDFKINNWKFFPR